MSVNTIPTESIRIRSAVSNAGPGDERHAKRNDAEFVAAAAIARAKSHELAHGQAKQNQTAGDLKIFHRDSERVENNFAHENETDGNAEARENSEHRLMFAIFGRRAGAEPGKDCDQTDWIDRNEKRNKREQKFLEIWLHRHAFCTARARS